MPVVRVHSYHVESDQLCALLAQRAALIDEIRSSHSGLTETRFTRLDDGTYNDTWRWASAEQMLAAFGGSWAYPLLSAITGATVRTGEIIDER